MKQRFFELVRKFDSFNLPVIYLVLEQPTKIGVCPVGSGAQGAWAPWAPNILSNKYYW